MSFTVASEAEKAKTLCPLKADDRRKKTSSCNCPPNCLYDN